MDRIQIFCYGFCDIVERESITGKYYCYEGTEPGADGYLYDIYCYEVDGSYKAVWTGDRDE